MKTNLLHKFLFSSAKLGVLALALAFFSTQAHAGIVLPAVGPTPPGQQDKVSCGYLKVYSATQEAHWGEGSNYYPHTSYWIYTTAGKKIKTVENHSSSIDEDPEKVELPAGRYIVKAWSDNDGLVTVPVIIKIAQMTKVHLEDGRDSDKEIIKSTGAVKAPSGQVVGWKA